MTSCHVISVTVHSKCVEKTATLSVSEPFREREREWEKMPSFKAEKLRVNLRLSINRLKLLEKKKSKSITMFTSAVSRATTPRSTFSSRGGMYTTSVLFSLQLRLQ